MRNDPALDEPTVIASLNPDGSDYLAPDTMKVARVNGQRVALVRSGDDVFAIDNACPHQGYGLVTGDLATDESGEPLITCLWHNWKFRARDGVCVLGEENVTCHRVDVDPAGSVRVSLTRSTPEQQLAVLWPSLTSALERHYVGQISRDTVRLLDNGATPAQVMAAALTATVDRTEDGVDHEVALAADCLVIAEERTEDDRVLPLVVGMAGLAEQTRDRNRYTAPPTADGDLMELIEAERVDDAMGRAATLDLDIARHEMICAASHHHLGYGHGAIYTQKVFELIDRIGAEIAPALLPQLARSLTLMTREDLLPYMRPTTRSIGSVDLDALAGAARSHAEVPLEVVASFLDGDDPQIDHAVDLAMNGLGVEGLIDIASLGSAIRMLRYDSDNELDVASNFNWLSITHGLTHARAARWAWTHAPGPAVARMALHAMWLLFDTGRLERRTGTVNRTWESEEIADRRRFEHELLDDAMDDRGGSFIVVAHLVKTARAGAEESASTGSMLPLRAAERLIRGKRRERFVARNVAESIRFVRTGTPPKR